MARGDSRWRRRCRWRAAAILSRPAISSRPGKRMGKMPRSACSSLQESRPPGPCLASMMWPMACTCCWLYAGSRKQARSLRPALRHSSSGNTAWNAWQTIVRTRISRIAPSCRLPCTLWQAATIRSGRFMRRWPRRSAKSCSGGFRPAVPLLFGKTRIFLAARWPRSIAGRCGACSAASGGVSFTSSIMSRCSLRPTRRTAGRRSQGTDFCRGQGLADRPFRVG